jgi:hypothetical protein
MQNLGNVYIWGTTFVMSRTDAQNGVDIIFKSHNEQLQERNTNISRTMSDLHMKVKDLENERDCLVATLKLLHLDRKDSEKQLGTSGVRMAQGKIKWPSDNIQST